MTTLSVDSTSRTSYLHFLATFHKSRPRGRAEHGAEDFKQDGKHCMSEVWTGHMSAGSFFRTKNWQKWNIQLNYESMFSLPFTVNWPCKSAVTAFHFSEPTNCLCNRADLLAVRYFFAFLSEKNRGMNGPRVNFDGCFLLICEWNQMDNCPEMVIDEELALMLYFLFAWDKSIMRLFDVASRNCTKLIWFLISILIYIWT